MARVKRTVRNREFTTSEKEDNERWEKIAEERPSVDRLVGSGALESDSAPLHSHLVLYKLVRTLKKLREKNELSLSEVAEKCGIDKSALSRLENGQHLNPTINTLCRYAEAVGVEIEITVAEPA